MGGRVQEVRRLAWTRMLLVVPCGALGTLQCRSGGNGLSIGSVILAWGAASGWSGRLGARRAGEGLGAL